MKIIRNLTTFITLSLSLAVLFSCNKESVKNFDTTVSSPDGKNRIEFSLNSDGEPTYQVFRGDVAVIESSKLGFEFGDSIDMSSNFELVAVEENSIDEIWTPVWGEYAEFTNKAEELILTLTQKGAIAKEMKLVFRAYDDGIAFRFEFPEQANLKEFEILDEVTEFRLVGDPTAWWQKAQFDSYELRYQETKLSEMPSANTPATFRTQDSLYLSIHEAALTDFAGMTLLNKDSSNVLVSQLVPISPDSPVKVKHAAPMKTPWRTVQIAETAGALIESQMIVNLNEPNKIEDTSWIHPAKYMGIWWEMHLNKGTWENKNAADLEHLSLQEQKDAFKAGKGIDKKHAANTENVKKYIDFASKHEMKGLLVEGWNYGWERGWKNFNFTTPYPDFDMQELTKYAQDHDMFLIGHHETGGDVGVYEDQLEDAFKYYNENGVPAVKTGYVRGEGPVDIHGKAYHHHGQRMVQHYRRVLEVAAKNKVMVVGHEIIKPTGVRRTYPNMLSRECVRGQEYNAWDAQGGNKPWHTTVIPFTRMLGGPIDFTPGIFNLTFDEYRPDNRVHTTLAKQLALYVVIYSPVQMAADLPEHYEGNPAFQFIENVPVNWDDTKVLDAEIGNYVVTARKNRNDWYLGAITDEEKRSLEISLDFLDEGATYEAVIYSDSEKTDLENNPTAYEIRNQKVSKSDILNIDMKESGGQAIHFKKLK
ncbi:glycoside hydrolase family 97 protein [Sediminitomix flava]|uniref:Alpha-glucosidase n=1 Tax=Sediminitomix flava TaxID=379075 RepID=A0A315ZBR5_SEDFL|nr:glycoside hydrolase family 97 protein [Sediminitomix flava]PWJ43016.1 alpha-glucosidase [Sediminitomix flava]